MVEDGGHVEGERPWRVRHHRPLLCAARDRRVRAVAPRRRRRAPPAGGPRDRALLRHDRRGRAFPEATIRPAAIGHKALAVNLSDLAAKGARPYVYLLALALPAKPDPAWLEAFASGLGALQRRVGVSLVGGDTTRTPGPLEHHHHRARPGAARPRGAPARRQTRRPSLRHRARSAMPISAFGCSKIPSLRADGACRRRM